ncbi:unnamed protein product [Bursaphelenchus okinawaensis]|uniref:Peptidase A1 domain-containing protein n=1 Tax=Bursaphelenchus okinawaensis TaxID=465554 RepID=A0A811KSZ1_9BILA|nr:unnamed protein product [Bursaphelenchus okinawaensis]CAG9110517.1 unnamed protein product [Bursaphelenchus okinawaensis]
MLLLSCFTLLCFCYVTAYTEVYNKNNNDDVKVQTQYEFEVDLNIGSPAKQYTFGIDIQSEDSWIYSSSCEGLSHHRDVDLYIPNNSKTFKNLSTTFEKTYDNIGRASQVSGYAISDSFKLSNGGTAQNKINLITSLKYTDITQNEYSNFYSGLLGLGVPHNNNKDWIGNYMFTGYRQVMCLGNVGDNLAFRSFGSFPNNMMTYNNLSQHIIHQEADLWTINVNKFRFGKYILGKFLYAAPSTLTSAILLPNNVFSIVLRTLGASEQNGNYYVNCDKKDLPALEIQVGTTWITVTSERYIDRSEDSNCKLLLKPSASDTNVTLGTAFFNDHSFCLNYEEKLLHFIEPVLH